MKNNYKNKRVLITGNTGFKGTWLTLTLHLFGAKVIGYADKLPKKNSVIDSIWMQNNITQYRKKIENITAEKALQIGLITRLVPEEELLMEVKKMAANLAKFAPFVPQTIKAVPVEMQETPARWI